MSGKHVAVVGAGAAGLVTARELRTAGHQVTVFERSNEIGGIWAYTPDTEEDALGRPPSRRIHSSMYASLRTNLPRDLMAFLDYTFDSAGGGQDDWPRYPHHECVLEYLENYAETFGLNELIQFETSVDSIKPGGEPGPGKWDVMLSSQGGSSTQSFDAIAICNGHYSRPRVPDLPGLDHFTGDLIHSHNYRVPEPFRGKRVALWGTAASGADISREISSVAKEVHWCGNAFANQRPGTRLPSNVLAYPTPIRFENDGTLSFPDGTNIEIDVFMFCTGYHYDFPFLADDIVKVQDNWVYPLYLDIVPPSHPTMGFIGIPYLIVPFPLFQIQAKWFAAVLDERVTLPPVTDMIDAIEAHRRALGDQGLLQRHFHKLGDNQPAYYNKLAAQCGEPPLPAWFSELAKEAQESRLANPGKFRDMSMPAHGPTRVS